MTHRIRFEVRVLGVATAEKWHFEESIPELPTPGDLSGPLPSKATWRRRVIAIEKAPEQWNVAAVVKLEDIDCSRLQRDFEAEKAALREAGWKR